MLRNSPLGDRWVGLVLATLAAGTLAVGGCRGSRVRAHGSADQVVRTTASIPIAPSSPSSPTIAASATSLATPLPPPAAADPVIAAAPAQPANGPAMPALVAMPNEGKATDSPGLGNADDGPAPAPKADEPPAPAPAMPADAPAAPAPKADDPPAPAPAPAPEAPPQTPPAPPPAPVDPGAAAKALADEAARQMAIEREKAQFLVKQKLNEAKALEAKQDYPGAETVLLQAHDLAPTNAEVTAELALVQQILSRRGPTAASALEETRTSQMIRVEQQRTTAQNEFNMGKVAFDQGDYDGAIEHYQQSLMIIESSPVQVDWRNLKPDAESGLAEAVRAKEEKSKSARRQQTEEALGRLAGDEEQRLVEEMRRLESMMGVAVQAYERGEFATAEDMADRILQVQPDNGKARELKDAATAAGHDQVARDHLKIEQQRFREWYDEMQATRTLEHKILKWPSQRFWDRITRARATVRSAFGATKSDPDEVALRKKLATTTVNLSVESRPFKEVLQTLQIQTGVNLYIDARIVADVGEVVVPNIQVEGIALKEALDMLMAVPPGGDVLWNVQGNVVVFTKKEYVKHTLTLHQHSVADMTTGLTDFIPPRIDLVSGDQVNDEANPLFGGEGEEPVKPFGTIEDLIELIKSAVGGPGTWEVPETSIAASGQIAIIVKHTAEVQDQVAKFLNDLRAFAGIVVTVETRFLQVSDDFLRDVGVDFRGLGGQTPGTLVNLDDVTNGLTNGASSGRDNGGPGLPAGAALNPSAGAYFNDGRDGDFRGRTENIFDKALGGVLSSLGGATFTLSYLDDSQFAAVVKAVEKTQKGRTLTAPTITVYNTQRANVTVVNQLSYIQDFDVEVAQTSSIADPIIGVIQDGLTLDVRPTVSNDRKYITLELQPTVAKLVEPIPTFSTTLGSSFSPVIIQLPELKLQQAKTTVRIPDGGSILIGGLKNISTVDRSSEVPLIAKIPLLSFLFSRKGRSDEMSNLMILVRATITDLQEQEAKFRGR